MMDRRRPLETGTVLQFQGLECHVESLVGCGSNAMVYRGWYQDNLNRHIRHEVLIKELFPLDEEGGIHRDEAGRIVTPEDMREEWEDHRASFERGNEMHLLLLKDHPEIVGGNVNTYALNGTWYTLLNLSGGGDMEGELAEGRCRTLRQAAQWMLGLLEALAVFHDAGYLHLDIAPDNVLIIPRGDREDVLLIDYNSVYAVEDIRTRDDVVLSLKDGYYAPEVFQDRRWEIGFPTDLYSAAAVFFRMVADRCLTETEQLMRRPPVIQGTPLLAGQPDTVQMMANQILQRGLCSMVKGRFAGTRQMAQAFRRLIDCIDGVGVTRWTLLERQRAQMSAYIRANPSAAFLTDDSARYPVRVSLDGQVTDVGGLSRGGVLLRAGGGMGKTTAMQLAALAANAKCSPGAPVAVYLAASGYRSGENWFVHDSILRQMKFGPDMTTYEAARHALDQVMQKPLQTQKGPAPSVLLLVDGLNEAAGDTAPLLAELRALADMPGVALVVSSRGDVPLEGLTEATILPLAEEDVSAALGVQGLLMPEETQMRQLLCMPLLLTMFIRTAREAESQVSARTAEELMAAFLDALVHKAAAGLPDDSPERWQTEVAVRYVLPMLAGAQLRADGLLDRESAMKEVRRAWRVIASPDMGRAFPQWAGRRRLIRGDARSAEDWYGQLVQGILWQRLGLLAQDGGDSLRVFHQTLAEYLAGQTIALKKRVRSRWWLRSAVIALVVAVLAVGGWGWWRVNIYRTPYSAATAGKLVNYGYMAASDTAHMLDGIQTLLDDAAKGDAAQYARDLDKWRADNQPRFSATGMNMRIMQTVADKLKDEAEKDGAQVVAASQLPVEIGVYEELIAFGAQRMAWYEPYLDLLGKSLANPAPYEAGEHMAELPRMLGQVLAGDRQVAADLFVIASDGHVSDKSSPLDPAETASYLSMRMNYPLTEEYRAVRGLPAAERNSFLEAHRKSLDDSRTELERKDFPGVYEKYGTKR